MDMTEEEKQPDIREAILDYENQIARDPQSDAYFPLAELYMELDENKKACEICVYGLKYHPAYYKGYLILGETLVQLGKLNRAEKAYATAFKMNPSESEPLFFLCRVYEKMDNLRKLQEVMHQLEIISPYDKRLQDIRNTVQKIRKLHREIKNKSAITPKKVEPDKKESFKKTAKIPRPLAQRPLVKPNETMQSQSKQRKSKVSTKNNIIQPSIKPPEKDLRTTTKKAIQGMRTPANFNFDAFIEDLFKIENINGIVFMNDKGQVSRSTDFDVETAKALAKILRSYNKAFKISFGILRYGDWLECTIDLDEGYIFLLNIGSYKLAFQCDESLKLGNFRAKLRSTLESHRVIIRKP